jgi:hypothetical protein
LFVEAVKGAASCGRWERTAIALSV